MEITDLIDFLETFEFPEFSLADLGPKVEWVEILMRYGHYCRENHIKKSCIKNRHNPSISFLSHNKGKITSMEIKHSDMGLMEKATFEYDRASDSYKSMDEDGYELIFYEEKNSVVK